MYVEQNIIRHRLDDFTCSFNRCINLHKDKIICFNLINYSPDQDLQVIGSDGWDFKVTK